MNEGSRLSLLSKLNLLGLIDLSIIACNIKLSKDIDGAMRSCEDSITNLKLLNKEDANQVGIASQNLIEELQENLMKIKSKDLDVEEIAHAMSPYQQRTGNSSVLDEELQMLQNVRKGNKIVGSREYNLVFFITCFVPFVRPTLPTLKQNEIARMKSKNKI